MFTNFGSGAETDNNSAETDKSGYTSKYQYLGPPLVAVPKNTIAVPKQKKLVPKRTKFKVPKKVPKRVATLIIKVWKLHIKYTAGF